MTQCSQGGAGELPTVKEKTCKLSFSPFVVGASLLLGGPIAFATPLSGTQELHFSEDNYEKLLTPVDGLSPLGAGEDGMDAWYITSSNPSHASRTKLRINSDIMISAGHGGAGDNNDGNSCGGNGGDSITGSDLSIINQGMILGGSGGSGADHNGDGGEAVTGDNLFIINGEIISGGHGGDSYSDSDGGNGGDAVTGVNLPIINKGTISGGNGGNNYGEGDGGNGGDAITGSSLSVINKGTFAGGNGGAAYGYGYDGYGGNAITGDNLSVINNGAILGGNGGHWGDAINGSNMTIANSGYIISGKEDDGTQNVAGNAIHITGGNNSLILHEGSVITGDVQVNNSSILKIINNDYTGTTPTIEGDLCAGDCTTVSLSGNKFTVSGDVSFGENSSLNLAGISSLEASGNMSFGNNVKVEAIINNWAQKDYKLLSADKGITGFSVSNISIINPLLTTGAIDYTKSYISDQNKLIYGLSWNDTDGDSHGEFNLKENAELTVSTILADNLSHHNINSWDGKSLTKSGEGTLILAEKNTYSGFTNINAGILKMGTVEAMTRTAGVIVNKSATLNFSGMNQTVNTLLNSGTVLINNINAPFLPDPVIVTGNMTLEKNGHVILNNSSSNVGQTYVQKGNWHGKGGILSLGAVLGNDNSKTDRLEIAGHASGITYVAVTNEGGSGDKTLEGVQIISTDSSDKNAFIQKGRIVAGSYDYRLKQGTVSGLNTNKWYLTSQMDNQESKQMSNQESTQMSSRRASSQLVSSLNLGEGSIHTWRPEAGSYIANLIAMNTMFSPSLYDRHGSTIVDPTTGQLSETTMWIRTVGGHNEHNLADRQLKTTANRMVYQIGGDILKTNFTDHDGLHVGIMGAYGYQDSKTHNKYTSYSSRGTVSGYTAGLYSSWFQDEKERTGLYMDAWLQYSWFNNTVKGDGLTGEKYSSKGITGALEAGYIYPTIRWTAHNNIDNALYLNPQVQITRHGVKANDYIEHNGTMVTSSGGNNIQAKLGLRTSLISQSCIDKETLRKFEPFLEVNWKWSSKQYGVIMNGMSNHQIGNRNVIELKTGVGGRLADNLSIWGNVSQQLGNNSYRDTQGILGVKYTF